MSRRSRQHPGGRAMTGPHNILFVVESLNVGGSEKFLKDLVLGLDRTKFSPTVCCLAGKGRLAEPLEKAGVRVVSLNWRLGSFASTVSAVFGLARLMHGEKADLVQTIYYRPEILAALASCLVWRPVLVASQHDVIVPEGRVSGALLRLSRLRVRHVIANCEACGRHRQSLTSHRPEQVSVIHIGLKPEEGPRPVAASASGSADRQAATGGSAAIDELFGSGPVVTYAGRLHPIKGPDVFLEAAAGLANRRPSVTFLLVGEGPMRAELAEQAARLGLAQRIKFTGHVPSLMGVLRRSAVFVCSSRSEGFPSVVLEAMQAGVPVVASNVGGVPELVTDRVNGLLFESENHEQLATLVEGLLLDEGAARTFAAKAREKVQREFRFEDTLAETRRLYLRLLGEEDHEAA